MRSHLTWSFCCLWFQWCDSLVFHAVSSPTFNLLMTQTIASLLMNIMMPMESVARRPPKVSGKTFRQSVRCASKLKTLLWFSCCLSFEAWLEKEHERLLKLHIDNTNDIFSHRQSYYIMQFKNLRDINWKAHLSCAGTSMCGWRDGWNDQTSWKVVSMMAGRSWIPLHRKRVKVKTI